MELLESRRMLSAVPQAVLDAGAEPVQWKGRTVHAVPGQWLLKLDDVDGDPDGQVERANGQLARVHAAIRAKRHLGADGLLLVETPKDMRPDQVERTLKRLGGFEYVEPDGILWSAELSNDPSLGQLWGLNNTGQTGGTPDADIDAPEAWNLTTGGADVVVGVIDSGVDYKHPDLARNMWVNSRELNGRRNVDDDGNGYKDDVYGYDFLNLDGDPTDDRGHGTHVAGTIAAAGNNGLGVVGVSWNAKVMALKFLGADGTGPWSAAAEAINYVTKMKTQFGVNLKVTNNSYGGWSYSEALYDAIKRNGETGMMFVAAAGNDGSNVNQGGAFPGAFDLPNIVSVAATDHNDVLASFSNYGAVNVDLAAPGSNILSTLPGGSYGLKSGTSMAAPHVTGVAALAWSLSPTASFQQVRSAILTGADKVASLDGKVFSGGRLNARAALERVNDPYVAPSVPLAPTDLAAVASLGTRTDGSTYALINLSWQHVADADLQRYDVYRSVDGAAFTRVAAVPAGTMTYREGNLLPGTTYAYYMTAGNYLFRSGPSDTAQATTPGEKLTIPEAPTNLIASAASKTQVNLSWSDNSTNESAFSVERSTDGSSWTEIAWKDPNVASHADLNLKRNVRYYYRVRAYNAVGYSTYSNVASAVTSVSFSATAIAIADWPAENEDAEDLSALIR